MAVAGSIMRSPNTVQESSTFLPETEPVATSPAFTVLVAIEGLEGAATGAATLALGLAAGLEGRATGGAGVHAPTIERATLATNFIEA